MITSVVKTPLAEIRWLSGYHLHLTLLFLGNITEEAIPEISQKLANIHSVPNFQAVIEETGIFPDERHARIFWLGIQKGAEQLVTLQNSIKTALEDFYPQKPEERFTPHITIGRLRSGVKPKLLDFTHFLNTVYQPIKFRVNEFILYESILTQEGPKYTVIENFSLKTNI